MEESRKQISRLKELVFCIGLAKINTFVSGNRSRPSPPPPQKGGIAIWELFVAEGQAWQPQPPALIW